MPSRHAAFRKSSSQTASCFFDTAGQFQTPGLSKYVWECKTGRGEKGRRLTSLCRPSLAWCDRLLEPVRTAFVGRQTCLQRGSTGLL
eukprot:4573741-Pyramimonas_sp.AAC.1